ncbi:hypothetical protein [Methanococcoides methylutens]|uniref:Uncharacterized protein n=1 Tax=Methanococcoides methylutens MM1 TaxID=1434104 RepID=A0A0E3SSX0_METMT|nr:hypothetical protein [Methanococcoides methylutens]AKB85622.1 hypothetical protein MCMEM_1569 [Methanococcoides methylutens MM1]
MSDENKAAEALSGEVYTIQDAVRDGKFMDLDKLLSPDGKRLAPPFFGYVSMGIMEAGMLEGDGETVNMSNFLDLMWHCAKLVRTLSHGFEDAVESSYIGDVEFPDGKMRTVDMEMYEDDNFTLMFPHERL